MKVKLLNYESLERSMIEVHNFIVRNLDKETDEEGQSEFAALYMEYLMSLQKFKNEGGLESHIRRIDVPVEIRKEYMAWFEKNISNAEERIYKMLGDAEIKDGKIIRPNSN